MLKNSVANSAWRVRLDAGQAVGLEIELRDARIVREERVDPRGLEPAGEHGVLRGVDHPLPGEDRRRREHREHGHGEDQAKAPRNEEPRGEEPDDEHGEQRSARDRARSGRLALEPDPERSRHGVDPGLVRELAERQDRRKRERKDDAGRRRDAAAAAGRARATRRTR